MPNYKKMYFELAAKVADAVELLIQAQQHGEAHYVESEPEVVLLPTARDKENGER